MVGIVLVSHSALLADGTAELARQMGGEDVVIEAAGGLDLPERPIGTDAMVVLAAIDRAWSGDGVLVLMDLGSAVLSAEMAVEMLEDDRRKLVRLTSAPFVEGAVAAAVAARLGRSLEDVLEEARTGLAPKAAHLGDEPPAEAQAAAAAPAPDETSIRLIVTNRLGLHARPAARFVTTASGFDARVLVRDLTNGRGPADARSLNAVATLGVLQGHEIEITASGPAASEVLDAVLALAERNFGDAEEPDATAARAPAPAHDEGAGDRGPAEDAGEASPLRGIAASPGIAIGPVRHLVRVEAPAPEPGAPDEERARFDAAVREVAEQIRQARRTVAARAGEAAAEIFDAHLLVLVDEEVLRSVREAIAGGRAAIDAWRSGILGVAARWRALEDPYLRSRAEDVEAVGRQVADALAGGATVRPSGDGVLVAPDMTPGQTAALDLGRITALATARGGPTSHVAVLARSLGLPAVVALGPAVLDVPEGTDVVVDGEAGTVLVHPDAARRAEAEARAVSARSAAAEALAAANAPARTRDGHRIDVFANVGRPEDAAASAVAGADGVGLLRTEFLFLDRERMPDEDEQAEAYAAVADALPGKPVVLRTLDVGGDKPLPYVHLASEANPFLGVRGLRLGLARPELLRSQVRAAARAAVGRRIRVMFPMVATPDEVRRGRAIVEEVLRELGPDGPGRLEVGAMVEVPAAALGAVALGAVVDFFSIGTNDLTQYTLAAERGNDAVASLADGLHPAVLRLIEMTAAAGAERSIPVGVCGELASDVAAVPLLLGLGVNELSVAPPAVPRVKAAVRRADLRQAREVARRALAATSATEVRSLLRERSADPG
jgi:phosphoenolpyruvate-protein phosphotransferase/dihydroxyacetone kinase phosphotransfer subunit